MASPAILTRGVEQVVPHALAQEKLASGKRLRIYLGIDPTGAKLHVGHSVPLRKLQAFADAGHDVVFLVGSFTAMIGDPSGREMQREPLTREQVEDNFQTYRQQASKILDFSKVTVRYNHEWLERLSFADILTLAGHFTVQQLMERDMFRRRMSFKAVCPTCKSVLPVARSADVRREDMPETLPPVTCPSCATTFSPQRESLLGEDPVSTTEFLYPLMQGYDSVMLDVDFEVGGSDQLFNMLCGRKLQKAFGKREKCVLTTKLLEGTDGRKMSKTYDNCIWLEDAPEDMYAKTMRINDALITEYMECCTDIPMEEVRAVEEAMRRGANPMTFKKRLAGEMVRLYHGEAAARTAEEAFMHVFSERKMPEEMPETEAQKDELLLDVLVRTKVIASKSEGRRLLQQKAVQRDDVLVTDPNTAALAGTYRVGKRKFLRILPRQQSASGTPQW